MKYLYTITFLFLAGCSGHATDNINFENLKEQNKLLLPE